MMTISRNGFAFALVTSILLAAALPVHAQTPESGADEARRKADSAKDYVIGVEDVIEITVWKNPELSMAISVRPDGKIRPIRSYL